MSEEVEVVESPVSEIQAEVLDDIQKPIYNKRQLSDVVDREKKKAYERGKKEARMELEQEAPVTGPKSLGGMPQLSAEDVEKMIAEKAPQALQGHIERLKAEQTASNFMSKMQSAESKYPGMQEKLNDLDYSTLAPIIELANGQDNTADIINELLENPMKMGNLLTLQYTQPRLAMKAMNDLARSIKSNQEALGSKTEVREPLAQNKSSHSTAVDNSAMSVSDFRKMFR